MFCAPEDTHLALGVQFVQPCYSEICNVLKQVRFATSKTEVGIYYNKLSIRVASRVAEGLRRGS